MLFFTSDHHFGHQRLIDHGWRPFASLDDMHATLIRNHNRTVAPTDTVIFLGDVVMGTRTETLPLVDRLTGRKILVCGNHDHPFPGNGTPERRARAKALYETVFEKVLVGTVTLDHRGRRLTLSHFPPFGDHTDEDRYVEHRPVDDGGIFLHGHTHSTDIVTEGRFLHVGVDAHNYTPVALDDLLDHLETP